jgi:ElaB/YqjD/DUF883 family membrane-anchored ribosome-binding protein
MDTASIDNGAAVRTGSRRQEFSLLIDDTQDLLSRVGHLADPEIAKLRAKVEHSLASAKQVLVDRSHRVQRRAKDAMSAGDSYVRERPWSSVGIAAAAGLVVGFLAGRR